MLIEGRDFHVVILDFPTKVHEAIYWDGIGHYTIFLNSADSSERQRASFLHALKHAEEGHFQCFNIQSIEQAAHGG